VFRQVRDSSNKLMFGGLPFYQASGQYPPAAHTGFLRSFVDKLSGGRATDRLWSIDRINSVNLSRVYLRRY
jgi:hypothetical protein